MKRREFIKQSCFTCVALSIGATSFVACSNIKTVNSFEENGYLLVNKSEFEDKQNNSMLNRLLITSNYSKEPILLLRTGEDSYSAYLLRCPHKGEKLDVKDSKLLCSAHGSEFDLNGKVTKGPAKRDLTQYIVDKDLFKVKIKLQ